MLPRSTAGVLAVDPTDVGHGRRLPSHQQSNRRLDRQTGAQVGRRKSEEKLTTSAEISEEFAGRSCFHSKQALSPASEGERERTALAPGITTCSSCPGGQSRARAALPAYRFGGDCCLCIPRLLTPEAACCLRSDRLLTVDEQPRVVGWIAT